MRKDPERTDLPKKRNVLKSDARVRACAAIDEASCFIGLARTKLRAKPQSELLKELQRQLVFVAAHAAGLDYSRELAVAARKLESVVGEARGNARFPGRFVVPGSCESEALLHCARAKCRTAETVVCRLKNSRPAIAYLNLLSKYLFLAACPTRNPGPPCGGK